MNMTNKNGTRVDAAIGDFGALRKCLHQIMKPFSLKSNATRTLPCVIQNVIFGWRRLVRSSDQRHDNPPLAKLGNIRAIERLRPSRDVRHDGSSSSSADVDPICSYID